MRHVRRHERHREPTDAASRDGTTWALLAPDWQPDGTLRRPHGVRLDEQVRRAVRRQRRRHAHLHVRLCDEVWTDSGSTAGPTTGADRTAWRSTRTSARSACRSYRHSDLRVVGRGMVAGNAATPTGHAQRHRDDLRRRSQAGRRCSAASTARRRRRHLAALDDDVDAAASATLPPARMQHAVRLRPAAQARRAVRRPVDRGRGCMAAQCELVQPSDTWEWDGRQWHVDDGHDTAEHSRRDVARLRPERAGDPHVWRRQHDRQRRGRLPDCADTTRTSIATTAAAWTQENNATHVHGSRTAAAAFDVTANRFVTFGGVTGDTWRLQPSMTQPSTLERGSGWDAADTPLRVRCPQPSAMAYDRVRNRTVLFSGNPRDGSTVTDTWEWNNATWTKLTPAGGIAPTRAPATACCSTPTSGRVVLFGTPAYADGEDVWEWNGTAWKQRTQIGSYPSALRADRGVRRREPRDRRVSAAATTASCRSPSRPGLRPARVAPERRGRGLHLGAVDYDNDGKAGCADDECWSVCTPLLPARHHAARGRAALRRRHLQRGLRDLRRSARRLRAAVPANAATSTAIAAKRSATCPNDC